MDRVEHPGYLSGKVSRQRSKQGRPAVGIQGHIQDSKVFAMAGGELLRDVVQGLRPLQRMSLYTDWGRSHQEDFSIGVILSGRVTETFWWLSWGTV